MNPKFDHIPPMCILLKLHYAKSDVSRLFCLKVIEDKPLGFGSTPSPPSPLVKEGLKQMKLIAYFIKFIDRIRCLSFQSQSVNMVSSVNKYKISLEPAKHINDRIVKLLHQTVEADESNIENRTRRSKIKSNGASVKII